MDNSPDLICAYVFDGRGGGRALDWDGVRAHRAEDGWLWVHLHREAAGSRAWLETESRLDEVACEALLSSESRPRCEGYGENLLLSLRGVNLNPGADPEDMVALVLWAEAGRIISVRRRRIMAVDAIRASIAAGRAPRTAGDFLAELSEGLVERMGPVIDGLEEEVADLEEQLLAGRTEGIRSKLADLRQTAIALRRYIAPQREAMARLLTQQADWISPTDRRWLREVADRITRYVEDLDAVRERAQIVQEELSARIAEQINRNMYVLSIVAAVFLPLGLLTGYLGINVGGIPGVDWKWSFAVVGLGLLVIAALEIWLLRRLKWV
jgi:zinc transporter